MRRVCVVKDSWSSEEMALPGEIDLRRAAGRCGVGRSSRVVLCARADDAIRMSRLLRVVRVRLWVCGRQTGGLGRNAKRAKQRVGRDGVRVEVSAAGRQSGIWRANRKKQVVDNMHTVQGDRE
jgi:hypothetical protein